MSFSLKSCTFQSGTTFVLDLIALYAHLEFLPNVGNQPEIKNMQPSL